MKYVKWCSFVKSVLKIWYIWEWCWSWDNLQHVSWNMYLNSHWIHMVYLPVFCWVAQWHWGNHMTSVYCEIFILQKIDNVIIKGPTVKDHSGKACFIGLMYSQAGQLANGSQLQWVISQWSLITMQAAKKMLVTGDDVCHSKKVSNTKCHHLRLIQGPLLTGILVARIQIKSFNMLASAETSFWQILLFTFYQINLWSEQKRAKK